MPYKEHLPPLKNLKGSGEVSGIACMNCTCKAAQSGALVKLFPPNSACASTKYMLHLKTIRSTSLFPFKCNDCASTKIIRLQDK